ncbi:MAG: ATP-grasp domain-containing protein [Methylobacter sp.]|uniref:ATP-grasp domain-containing protein n=1 Tax=Candidatus Methylobacter titanis TaxID=3053457 RepID=A0AA43Q9L0_9GAMM|nr:ATP-grasp domain-containing protein [Candidatus Methylobacter titanis]
MAKTLMIIGAGIEQVPAYEAAKRRGLTIVGTDMNLDAPGFALADYKILVSTRDAEATEREAIKFHRAHPVHGVMTIANDVPYTVARVAHAIGSPSISLEAAKCVTDKQLMKQRFAEHGVACPWFSSIDSPEQLRNLIESNGERNFVLKPVDGRGARGVLLINSGVDPEWAYTESRRWGDSGRLILEEFIPGMQLSTETFILEGKCYTPAIAERNYSRLEQFRPNIIEDGGTIPAPLDDNMKAAVDDVILRGASALGITEGLIKGDIVIDNAGNPLIIELAARLSGGWLATHQIPAATGVNLVDAVISYSLGEAVSPAQLIPSYDRATAIRYWFPQEGKINHITGEEKLKQVPGLISYGFFRKKGDMQPKIYMHPDRFGYVIVSGDHRDEVQTRVKQALDCIQVEVTQ